MSTSQGRALTLSVLVVCEVASGTGNTFPCPQVHSVHRGKEDANLCHRTGDTRPHPAPRD